MDKIFIVFMVLLMGGILTGVVKCQVYDPYMAIKNSKLAW